MKVNWLTKRNLILRREERAMREAGYRKHETDWEIHRGFKVGHIITDAQVSADGMHVYTKIEPCQDHPMHHSPASRTEE